MAVERAYLNINAAPAAESGGTWTSPINIGGTFDISVLPTAEFVGKVSLQRNTGRGWNLVDEWDSTDAVTSAEEVARDVPEALYRIGIAEGDYVSGSVIVGIYQDYM